MPAVTEPLIVLITSREAEAHERENDGWVTSRPKKGSLFLTAAGAPYFRSRTRAPSEHHIDRTLHSFLASAAARGSARN